MSASSLGRQHVLVDTYVESANAQFNVSSELRNIAFAFLRRGHGSKQSRRS
jgi:hypothetical protein